MSRQASRLRMFAVVLITTLALFAGFALILSAGPAPVAAQEATPPALTLQFRAEPPEANAGESVVLVATIINESDEPLTDLAFEILLPEGLQYLDSSIPGLEYDPETGRLTWQLEELGARAMAFASIEVRPEQSGDLTISLTATGEALPESVSAEATLHVAGEVEEKPPLASPPPEKSPAQERATLTIEFSVDPLETEPGGVVTFTATVVNAGETSLRELFVAVPLPTGVAYAADSAVGFTYSDLDDTLTWEAEEIGPGEELNGSFGALVDGLPGDDVVVSLEASSPALIAPVQAEAVVHLIGEAGDEVWITPEEGGWLRSNDGRVELRFPAGAVTERTRVSYSPATDLADLPEYIYFPFELHAETESKQTVEAFEQPVELIYTYPEWPEQPAGLVVEPALFYFDEEKQEWLQLPASLDLEAQTLSVDLAHFSLYSEGNTSWVAEMMANIRGAQTNLFSGSTIELV